MGNLQSVELPELAVGFQCLVVGVLLAVQPAKDQFVRKRFSSAQALANRRAVTGRQSCRYENSTP